MPAPKKPGVDWNRIHFRYEHEVLTNKISLNAMAKQEHVTHQAIRKKPWFALPTNPGPLQSPEDRDFETIAACVRDVEAGLWNVRDYRNVGLAMTAIERKNGLTEDQTYFVNDPDNPPAWVKLANRSDQIYDREVMSACKRIGRPDLAEKYKADPERYWGSSCRAAA